MQIVQIIYQALFIIWMIAVAYLLTRHAIGAGAQSRKLMILLAESNQKSAQSAHEAAEAALKLAELLEKKHAS